MHTRLHILTLFVLTTIIPACGGDAVDPKSAQININNTAKDTCSWNIDENNDGKIDRVMTQIRNSNQASLSDGFDYNVDGITDSRILYAYDEHNNITRLALDNNADGTENAIITTTFDGQNHPLAAEQDADADGKIDYIYTYSYPNSELTIVTVDENADDTSDSSITYNLDTLGRIVQENTDRNNDGKIDSIVYYAYDSETDKNPFAIGYDDDADGNIDRSESTSTAISKTTTTQDSDGNQIIETDNDGNGTIDSRVIVSCKGVTS